MLVQYDDEHGGIDKIIEIYNKEHSPVVMDDNEFNNTLNIRRWFDGRCIPESREQKEKLLKATKKNNLREVMLEGYGLNLSDHYWIVKEENTAAWEEKNYFDRAFSPEIGELFFKKNKNYINDSETPESALNGALKKRWIIEDNTRKLIKGGTKEFFQEPFNEVLASEILSSLHIAHVKYELRYSEKDYYSICDCMVNKNTEMIPAWCFGKSEHNKKNYHGYIETLQKIGIQNSQAEMEKMIVFDYCIGNTDRHFSNFGIIRNPDTLQSLGIAPIFDSGTSLWCNRITISGKEETHSSCFAETNEDQIKLVENMDWFDHKKLKNIDEKFDKLLQKNKFIKPDRRSALCIALKERIEMVQEIQKSI
jgi:hypothetical protein